MAKSKRSDEISNDVLLLSASPTTPSPVAKQGLTLIVLNVAGATNKILHGSRMPGAVLIKHLLKIVQIL